MIGELLPELHPVLLPSPLLSEDKVCDLRDISNVSEDVFEYVRARARGHTSEPSYIHEDLDNKFKYSVSCMYLYISYIYRVFTYNSG